MQGGGVACYIHDSLTYRVLDASQNSQLNYPEFLILDIKFRSGASLLLAVVYRRPNGLLLSEFIVKLNLYSSAFKNVVIAGDLNCNLLTTNFESSFLRNFIADHSLYLIPYGPTHHTANSQTQIDVIIIDSETKISNYYQSQTPFIAGHDLIAVSYAISSFRFSQKTVTSRNFKNCDPTALAHSIESYLRGVPACHAGLESSTSVSVDELVSSLYSSLTTALDEHAPFTTRQVTKPMAPWLTAEIKIKIRIRDQLFKRAKRSNSQLILAQYKLLRNQTKRLIKDAKNRYLVDSLSEQHDPSRIWSTLRKLGLIDNTSNSSLQHFSPVELNQHYSTITSMHPPCSDDQFRMILQTPPPPGIPQFSFTHFSHEQVHQMLLSSLPKSRGVSPDGLQLSYLKDILPSVIPPLAFIYNNSISSGVYPSLWKTSNIIPLNKISNPVSPADTRPIANLCHLAKPFDALITRQITSFLDSNHLLNPQQSGFRRYHSTQTALLRIMDDVRQGIDMGYVTILVLFDFSKAFDTLNHSLILSSLRSFGFDELSLIWVRSYLSGRSQTIRDPNGNSVPTLPCTSGVPQGSSPGPILFIIFINSLFRRLKYCANTCDIFADDTQFHLSAPLSCIDQIVAELNYDIESLVLWARDTGLILNSAKTKAIILGSKSHMSTLQHLNVPPIVVDGVPIPYVNSVKNLGVHISSDLSWNRHISQISSNVHHALYRLKFRGSSLPSSVKLLLVNSLVIPYFDYACLVFNDASEYLDTKLQRLQNVALRFVFGLRRDSSLSVFRQEAGWLTTRVRRRYFLGSLTYQILNTSSPLYLHERFVEIDPTMRRSARSLSSSFILPVCRTDTYARSFWITAIQNWNTIPAHIQRSPSLNSFKCALFSYLLGPADQ